MAKCEKARFLCWLASLPVWPRPLARRHVERCPECQKGLAGIEEARRATVAADRMGPVKDFWPNFVRSREKDMSLRESSVWPRRRWWMAAAGLVATGLAIAVALLTGPPPEGISDSAVKVRIQSLRIYDEPAQAFIFQTPDANRTFIWVEQIPKGEKP